nr:hypothetical protein [Tanacetum cinerariifolium]
WRRGDKDRAAAMIQAINKVLKTRRIMRSLEKFVGGRLYEGDFRMLQRTIRFIICCSYLNRGDAIMDFVNQLGYPGEIHFVSRMVVNNLYQPWKAILSMINQCLTGKTFGFDRPKYPVLQMLWGIITRTNIEYAKLMWEEFVQDIQTFLIDKANLGSPTKKGKKEKPYVIPYSQFTKLIIYYLEIYHNIHQRSGSPLNLVEDDLILGNLKFIPKGEIDEVFRMKIPEKLITDNIRNAPYYNAYLEMVAKHKRGIPITPRVLGSLTSSINSQCGKKKTTTKADKPVKPAPAKQAKPATAKQPKPKPVKEKPTKPTPQQKAGKGKVIKAQTVKSSLQLVDKPDEEQDQPEAVLEPQGVGEEYDLERAIHISKGKAIETKEQAAQSLLALHTPKRKSTTDQFIFQRRTPPTKEALTRPSAQPQDDTLANIVPMTPSSADAEIGVDTDKAGSDPGKTPKSRPPPDDDMMDEDQTRSDPRKSHVALAGPNLKPMYDDFMATVYPKVHESLKFPADEQDLPHKINQTISEVVKEVVHIALEAPLRDRFRELPEADMKKILHQRMFESGSYKSLPEHVALYEALEASMERENRAVFLAEKDKSRKRCRNDQDPPPPLYFDLNKKKRHDFDTSGSKQPLALQSSAWKTSDTREAPSNSSKQQFAPHSEQPPVSKQDRPETLEQDRVIPPTDSPDAENNWANALAKSYKDLEENKLLSKTGDIGSFIKWFCKRIGKKKLNKSDLEVNLVNPEDHRLVLAVSKLLPLGGPPGQRNYFHITRHNAPSDRRVVRSHMRILSVISIKTFKRYGYTFLREIIIRRADYNEYKISEADFKNLHPNDFEDLYLLYLYNVINLWIMSIVIKQRVGDLQLGIESYQTKLNFTEPRWDASGFLFKDDYTIISKPRL